MTEAPDWSEDLGPGERLLWSGRPRPGLRFEAGDFTVFLFGLISLCFTLVMVIGLVNMIAQPEKGPDQPLASIFLTFFGCFFIGSVILSYQLLWGLWRRREYRFSQTFYALTLDETPGYSAGRALIRINRPHPKFSDWPDFTSWPITPATILEHYTGKRNDRIYLANRIKTDSEGDRLFNREGFDRLDDPDHVFDLLRQIQLAAKPAPVAAPADPSHPPAPDQA